MEITMRMTMLGAVSLAAITLVACAKKEAAAPETPAVEETAVDETAADVSDAAAEAADVYAAPSAVDLSTVRTKDALTAAADAAFAQVDADVSGALSQSEFYALAALMAPAEEAVDVLGDTGAEVAADAAGAVASEAAPAAEAVDGIVSEEPTADSSALDASFASIAGADASLTADDLRAAFLARFDAADVNLDGALDDAESATFTASPLL